jgi:hypothetical protein
VRPGSNTPVFRGGTGGHGLPRIHLRFESRQGDEATEPF